MLEKPRIKSVHSNWLQWILSKQLEKISNTKSSLFEKSAVHKTAYRMYLKQCAFAFCVIEKWYIYIYRCETPKICIIVITANRYLLNIMIFLVTIMQVLLIAFNLFPSRFTNRKVLFLVYLTNLVTHGESFFIIFIFIFNFFFFYFLSNNLRVYIFFLNKKNG